jgi:hypothetical protein
VRSLLSLFTRTDDLLGQESPIHDKGGAGGESRIVGTEVEKRGGLLAERSSMPLLPFRRGISNFSAPFTVLVIVKSVF